MSTMHPFGDDSSIKIGDLTIENGSDAISLYGDLDITRDRKGLAAAEKLKAIVDAAVDLLKADTSLPEALPPAPAPVVKPNPFG